MQLQALAGNLFNGLGGVFLKLFLYLVCLLGGFVLGKFRKMNGGY